MYLASSTGLQGLLIVDTYQLWDWIRIWSVGLEGRKPENPKKLAQGWEPTTETQPMYMYMYVAGSKIQTRATLAEDEPSHHSCSP